MNNQKNGNSYGKTQEQIFAEEKIVLEIKSNQLGIILREIDKVEENKINYDEIRANFTVDVSDYYESQYFHNKWSETECFEYAHLFQYKALYGYKTINEIIQDIQNDSSETGGPWIESAKDITIDKFVLIEYD